MATTVIPGQWPALRQNQTVPAAEATGTARKKERKIETVKAGYPLIPNKERKNARMRWKRLEKKLKKLLPEEVVLSPLPPKPP